MKLDIYSFRPKKGNIAERFDAYLMGKKIAKVEIHYKENGEIKRVDIFCER